MWVFLFVVRIIIVRFMFCFFEFCGDNKKRVVQGYFFLVQFVLKVGCYCLVIFLICLMVCKCVDVLVRVMVVCEQFMLVFLFFRVFLVCCLVFFVWVLFMFWVCLVVFVSMVISFGWIFRKFLEMQNIFLFLFCFFM